MEISPRWPRGRRAQARSGLTTSVCSAFLARLNQLRRRRGTIIGKRRMKAMKRQVRKVTVLLVGSLVHNEILGFACRRKMVHAVTALPLVCLSHGLRVGISHFVHYRLLDSLPGRCSSVLLSHFVYRNLEWMWATKFLSHLTDRWSKSFYRVV